MSRIGLYHGNKVTFTHRNPQTGEFWTDDLGKDGRWVDSKDISFDLEPKKRKTRFHRKER